MVETKQAKFHCLSGAVNGFVGLEKEQAILSQKKFFYHLNLISKVQFDIYLFLIWTYFASYFSSQFNIFFSQFSYV